MRIHSVARSCLIATLLVGISTTAFAQRRPNPTQKIDLGKVEYETKCATCHGLKGKGDGPTAPFLTKKAADLTTLAKRNNGVIPVSSMYETIEVSKEIPGHGSRDMPVWGMTYRIQAAEYYMEVPYDPEVYVRARILALIEYINRLQVK